MWPRSRRPGRTCTSRPTAGTDTALRYDGQAQVVDRACAVWNGAAGGGLVKARGRLGALALAADTRTEEDFVAATAARLPAGDWPDELVLTAVDAGRGERVAFRADDGVPLAAALAASRAIPGLLPPITIGGRRYIDGAVGSATNADLAAGAAAAIVVTPTPAHPPPNTLFALWDALSSTRCTSSRPVARGSV